MSIGGEIMEEWYEAQLVAFRQVLIRASKSESKEGEEAAYWLAKFDEHFGMSKYDFT